MRITRLALSDVRRHRRFELRPAPGLTIIRGPNESGKSTIQQAVELVLFRRATSASAEIAAVRSWDAPGDPTIELEFELDGRPGRLAKRFAGSRGTMRLELDGVVDTDPGRVEKLVAESIGIPSEKFLRSTASVRHFEMEDLDRDEKALRDRLQQSIGGGDVGASRARQRLSDRIASMRAAGAKNPGPLRRAQDDIALLTTQLHAGEAQLEQLSRDRATWAAATVARVALEGEVRDAETSWAEADTAVRLGAERATLTRRYEELRRATDLAERLAVAEGDPPTMLSVASLSAATERLRVLETEGAALRAERSAIAGTPSPEPSPDAVGPITGQPGGPTMGQDDGPTIGQGDGTGDAASAPSAPSAPSSPPAPAPSSPPAPSRLTAGSGRLIALVLLLAALAVIAVGLALAQPLVGGVIAIVALAGAAWSWRRDVRSRAVRDAAVAADAAARAAATRQAEIAAEARAEAARMAAEADARRAAAEADVRRQAAFAAAEVERRRADLDRRIAAVADETGQVLRGLGVTDRAAADVLIADARRHTATVDGIRAELRGLLGTDAPPSLGELRRSRDDAAAKAALGGHALEGLGAAGADPEGARVRAQAAVRGAQQRLRTAIDEEGQAKGRVSQNTVDAEAVAALAERLTARQEDLSVAERRLRIYQQTLDAISAAEAATIQKAARFLERRMGADLARITGGRYDRVRVDETDLGITVWSPEREAWVDAAQLSKGTADQLYLAARLGLVRQVTQDRRPPLVFDDPFVTFDDDRALRAMGVLRELAADHQVLYLTCSDRYDAAADAVVVLPAPVVVERDPGAPRPEPPPAAEGPFALTLPLDAAAGS